MGKKLCVGLEWTDDHFVFWLVIDFFSTVLVAGHFKVLSDFGQAIWEPDLVIYAVQSISCISSPNQNAATSDDFTTALCFSQSTLLRVVLAPLSLQMIIKEKDKLNRCHCSLLQCDWDFVAADRNVLGFQISFDLLNQQDLHQNKLLLQRDPCCSSFVQLFPGYICQKSHMACLQKEAGSVLGFIGNNKRTKDSSAVLLVHNKDAEGLSYRLPLLALSPHAKLLHLCISNSFFKKMTGD